MTQPYQEPRSQEDPSSPVASAPCASQLGPFGSPFPCSPLAQSTHYMGFLHTLLNQPSRSYSLPEPASTALPKPLQPAQVQAQDERAARKSQYYSAASDPNLRREWERILQNDRAKARASPSSPSLRTGARRIPISPLRHQAFAVFTRSSDPCHVAYGCRMSGSAPPRSGNRRRQVLHS